MMTHFDRLIFVGNVKLPVKEFSSKANKEASKLLVMTYTSSSLFRDHGASALKFAFSRKSIHGNALSLLGNAFSPDSAPESYFPVGNQLRVHKVEQNDPGIDEYLAKLALKRNGSETIYILSYVKESNMFPILLQNPQEAKAFHSAIVQQQLCSQFYPNQQPNIRLLKHIGHNTAQNNFHINPEVLSDRQQAEISLWSQSIQQAAGQSCINVTLQFKLVDKVALGYFFKIVPQEVLENSVSSLNICGCHLSDKMLQEVFVPVMKKTSSSVFAALKMQQMQELNLSNNNLTDSCFKTLSELIGGAGQLRVLKLSKNRIKLQNAPQFESQPNGRLSLSPSSHRTKSFRLSSSSAQIGKNSKSLLNMLNSLSHKIDLYLDDNLIKDADLICDYIIDAVNVPLRYLHVGGNLFNAVDVVRLAKMQVRNLREKGSQDLCLVDVGPVATVDFEVEQYAQLLWESRQKWKITPTRQNKVAELTANPEWEICNEAGMFDDLQANRKSSSPTRSKNRSRLLSMASNAMSESSPSVEDEQVNQANLHSTLDKLRQAYTQQNFSGVRVYKQMLREYNEQIYKSKIQPMFSKDEAQMLHEQKEILAVLREIFNFEGYGNEADYNKKIDATISRLLRRRIDYQVDAGLDSISADCIPEGIAGMDISWNAFLCLMELKIRRDDIIEQKLAAGYNPMKELIERAILLPNLYDDYFLTNIESYPVDDYEQLVRSHNSGDNVKNSQVPALVISNQGEKKPQKQLNKAIKKNYLKTSKASNLGEDEQNLCMLDPKMQPARFMLWGSHYKDWTKANVVSETPPLPESIVGMVDNMLQYLSKHDLMSGYPWPAKIKAAGILQHEGAKGESLNRLNEQDSGRLDQFAKLVVNLLKYLYHTPDRVAKESITYLHYLLNSTLNSPEHLKTPMADEFYLQFMTYPGKLNPGILASIIQLSSLYLPHSQLIQPFLISHLLKNETHPIQDIRLLRHNQPRFKNKDSLLNEQLLTLFICGALDKLQSANASPLLSSQISVWAMQDEVSHVAHNDFFTVEYKVTAHLLQPIDSILVKALSRHQARMKQQLKLSDWTLFIYDRSDESCQLLLPRLTRTLYDVYSKQLQDSLVIKKCFNSWDSFHELSQQLTEHQWVNRYLHVRQCFRQHGSLLGGEKSGNLIDTISWCIACEILLTRRTEIEAGTDGQDFSLSSLVGEFVGQIEQHSPKGTSMSLTPEQKLLIREYTYSHITTFLETDPKGSKPTAKHPFAAQLFEFERSCRGIALSLCLSDASSQSQLIISPMGLTYVNKILYITEIQWRQIYAIEMSQQTQANNPIKITLFYIDIDCKNKAISRGKKLQIVENMRTDSGRLFIRAAAALIAQQMTRLVSLPREKLIRFISERNLINTHIRPNKKEVGQSRQVHLTGSFWSLMNDCINFTQPTHDTNAEHSIQETTAVVKKTQPSRHGRDGLLESQIDIMVSNTGEQDEYEGRKAREDQHKRQSAVEIVMESIIEETQQKPKQQEQQIITNARRSSSKRQLPRRRSSQNR